MLTTFVLFFLPVILFDLSFSLFFLPLIIFFVFVWLVSWMNWFISFFLMTLSFGWDDMSFWLIYLSVFLVLSLIVFCSPISSFFTLYILLLICVGVFISSSFFTLYVLYEASLIPIFYIILKYGVYSERSKSIIYMLLYTTFFTFPLIICVAGFLISNGSFMIYTPLPLDSFFWLSLLIFFSFIVKFPVYGLHYWLPQAHVEAPTFGSMLLAGILLKLGGFGVFRMMSLVSLSDFSELLFVFLFFGVLISSFVTCGQVDFKRLVAYSSVIHMTSMALLIFSSNFMTLKLFVMVMVCHGVLSPMLFYLVSVCYKETKTRVILITGGISFSFYLIPLIVVIIFSMSIPTPPFIQFFQEVVYFISIFPFSNLVLVLLFFYTFLSLVYNLVWFIPLVISNTPVTPLSPPTVVDTFLFICLLFFILLFSFFTSAI